MSASEKPTNPKDLIGTNKVPFHLVPPIAMAHAALAHLDGNLKYGRNNWREAGVRSSVYVSAAMRHLMAWLEGADFAEDSGVHHLGHTIACCAILLDAWEQDSLVDDRNHKGEHYHEAMANLTELVAEIRARHADKHPVHYDLTTVVTPAEPPRSGGEVCESQGQARPSPLPGRWWERSVISPDEQRVAWEQHMAVTSGG